MRSNAFNSISCSRSRTTPSRPPLGSTWETYQSEPSPYHCQLCFAPPLICFNRRQLKRLLKRSESITKTTNLLRFRRQGRRRDEQIRELNQSIVEVAQDFLVRSPHKSPRLVCDDETRCQSHGQISITQLVEGKHTDTVEHLVMCHHGVMYCHMQMRLPAP